MSSTSAEPPSGTVTFLFTDIEGSTSLWETQPDAMRAALARHDALLRQVIIDGNGFVFRTVGDAFCAAFATAPEALAAALAAQLTLQKEHGDLPMPLQVRMGLHTGAVESRDNDYYGQPLNRVSRLMTAGHGGQILLSGACQELARDTLPAAVVLRDLGLHRLKDLSRPEQVFQVLHPALPADFPPLKSLNNPALPNNLLQQMTSFIGRETEVAEVKALLGKSRLLTLTGAGGSGKTRLALQAAADLLDGSGDGVWLVELAPLTDPDLVPKAVAEALGIREEPGRPIAKTLADALKSKDILIILDNCEHVLAACAFLVSDLLGVGSNVSLLATSRQALGVPGEQTYRVPSLSLPDPKLTYTAEALSQYEAVRLFIDRAGLSFPAFTVTNQNAPIVAQICSRLDGIPLAIELAAARVKALSVEQIGMRLSDRFRLLTGGSRTALPRQQTLKAAIDWSFDLLSGDEKTLLRRLSVFSGGCTLEAAEAVCADTRGGEIPQDGTAFPIEAGDTLDLLTSLIDKSLVVYEEDERWQGRYRLLETVRQYGQSRLLETGEAEPLRQRYQEFFLTMAEQAIQEFAGPKQTEWLGLLETEHDNMRAVLSWCLADGDRAEAGLKLSGVLGTFWLVRGYLFEGRQWLARTLEHAESLEPSERPKDALVWTKALTIAGGLASAQGEVKAAHAFFERAVTLAREAGDWHTLAYALRGLGWCKMEHDIAATRTLIEESLLLFRQVKDKHGITLSLRNLGDLAVLQHDYAPAQAWYAESLVLSRQMENQHGIAGSLVSLGRVAFARGDLSTARTLYEEALPLSRQIGDQGAIVGTVLNLGLVAFTQGNFSKAKALYEEALPLSRQLGLSEDTASALEGLGRVAAQRGDPGAAWEWHAEGLKLRQQISVQLGIVHSLEGFAAMAQKLDNARRAVLLWGASHAHRQALGTPLVPTEQKEQSKQLEIVCEALGNQAFVALFDEGRAMPLDAAVEYALSGADT